MHDSDSLYHLHHEMAPNPPWYYEYHSNCLINEPWNAISSIFFFVPVIYWVWRLRGEYRENKIIVWILPFLFLNGLGSTLFHAFRDIRWFIALDVIPALILSLMVAVFFWTYILKKWYWGLLMVLALMTLSFMAFYISEKTGANRSLGVNVSYFLRGMVIFLPAIFILIKTKWHKWHLLFSTMVLLSLALLARTLDRPPQPNIFEDFLPQGSHFLWHIFSALAVFTLGYYIYYLKYWPKKKSMA